MTLMTLTAEQAERAGCAVVDVREDEDDFPHAYDGERRLTCFSLKELAAFQAKLHEPPPAPMVPWTPGKPLKRGEKRKTEPAPRAWGKGVGGTRNTMGTLSGNRARRY